MTTILPFGARPASRARPRRIHEVRRSKLIAGVLAAGLLLSGCARPRAVVPVPLVDRGFPTKPQLTSIARAALPPRERQLRKGLSVGSWELAGPFPSRPGSIVWTGEDAFARGFAERLAARRTGAVMTESLACYAREIGRFVARHGQLPDDDLQAFAAGRCGVLPVTPSFVYSLPPGEPTDDEALKMVEESIERTAAPAEIGVWKGSEGGRHVVLATFGEPKATLDAIDSNNDGEDAVRVRGALLQATAWLRGYTSDGLLGFHACRPTPGAKAVLPAFDLTCAVARDDAYAVFDMLAAAPNAALGRQVLSLILPVARPMGTTFRRLPVEPARRGAPLLEQFNAVRVSLGRSALEEVPRQSETALALVPHYFAAAAQKDDAKVDTITLGMMAGWDVSGPLREAQFLSFRGLCRGEEGSFLDTLLFFPSNRAVLLDRDATRVAIATLEDVADHGTWGLLTTYTQFEGRGFPEVEKALLDELDHQRRAHGRNRALRVDSVMTRNALAAAMDRLMQGVSSPMESLGETLRTFSRRLARPFSGRVSYALAADGWRPPYDRELVDADEVVVAIKVGYFVPRGAHWGQYVSFIVFGSSMDDTGESSSTPTGRRFQ